jgi:hypothetical protein
VLSTDVRFEGFTQSDWSRFLSLFRPRVTTGSERDPERPQGGIVAIVGAGKLRKLVHTQAGRLRLEDCASSWPLSVEELARRHHASWGMTLEVGALENVMERFGAKLRRGDGLTAQLILLVSLLREEMLAGRIDVWPARLAGLPVPTVGMVDTTLDAVCPRGHAIALGLFDGGDVWTSIAMRRGRTGAFDWILGPDEIRRDVGLLAGDWRRDYRHLARALDHRVGPLALGVYAEASTFRELEVDPTPGAWARAVAIRDVILSPVPLALGVPLGIDAGRAAFSAVRGLAERAQGLGVVSPLLSVVRETLGTVATVVGLEQDAEGKFGFDPLEILRRLLSREK